MEQISNFFASLDYSVLYVIVGALISITFHEASHALTAYKLGDTTARDMGRLTLNPIRHIDLLGLLMMIFFRFGWAKPVPVNMHRFRKPKLGMAVVGIAGPISNMIMAAAAMLFRALFVRIYLDTGKCFFLTEFFGVFGSLNIGLGLFNLIPIPPLDGSRVVFAFLPDKLYYTVLRYERFYPILLIILLYTGVLSKYLNISVTAVANAMWKLAWAIFSRI